VTVSEKLSLLSEVKIGDLAQWLESQAGRDIKPTREKATYLVSKVTEALGNIRKVAVALSEEGSSNTFSSVESSKVEIAKKFGERIVGLVDEVRRPEPTSYETLLEFLGSLKRFHAGLIYAGSFWIRKLDQRYRESVRKMELSLSDVRMQGRMLEEHLDRKYRAVRKYETLLKEIEMLKTISEELVRLEDEIVQTRSQRESTQATCQELAEERQQLERSKEFLELSELESAVDKAREDIVSLFRPLEKPVEKLLKLSEREKQKLDPTAASVLAEYVKDPTGMLCSSKANYSELRSSLEGLQSILERNLLDLKDSRVRAALKSISRFGDRTHLEALCMKYTEAVHGYETASQSGELRSLHVKREEVESKLAEAEETVERLDRALSSLQARKDELSKRLTHLRAAIEKSIQEVTGESVHIAES